MPMLKILFLCTGNSCRSQMAEGWARHLKADSIEPYSAGIETHGLNPDAVQVMAEAGVDISAQRSKLVSELRDVAVRLRGHRLRPRPRALPAVSRQGQDHPRRLRRPAPPGGGSEDRGRAVGRVPSRARRDPRIRGNLACFDSTIRKGLTHEHGCLLPPSRSFHFWIAS